jgi:hypothetical protein
MTGLASPKGEKANNQSGSGTIVGLLRASVRQHRSTQGYRKLLLSNEKQPFIELPEGLFVFPSRGERI